MAHQSNLIANDIETYLKQHENKEILRFITCGSVDDGKSTLIGRLLYDSKIIFEDQMHYTIVKNTTFNGMKLPDLSILKSNGDYEVFKEFGYKEYKNRN